MCVLSTMRFTETSSFLFQAEGGMRYLVRSRGLGDVYKRQGHAVIAVDATAQLADGVAAAQQGLHRKPPHGQDLSLIHI